MEEIEKNMCLNINELNRHEFIILCYEHYTPLGM